MKNILRGLLITLVMLSAVFTTLVFVPFLYLMNATGAFQMFGVVTLFLILVWVDAAMVLYLTKEDNE